MSDWRDDIINQGRDAFTGLSLNTGRFREIIDQARTDNPYCGEMGELWLQGFDEAASAALPGLKAQDDAISEAARTAIVEAQSQTEGYRFTIAELLEPDPAARRLHDAGEWMDWPSGNAAVVDSHVYEAILHDGSRETLTVDVYAEDEFYFRRDDGSTIEDDHEAIKHLRLVKAPAHA